MKKTISILLIIAMILSVSMLTACSNEKEQSKELPLEISQDDWADSKQFVELSTGIKMAYVEMGDPNGEVVILQHGMTDNSRSWSLAAPYFAKAGYHVYLPDLRGMGKSDTTDGFFPITNYATDLKAFFDAMKIDKAIVIGHSLGSFTVQAFALMFPERVNKIVLVSSIPVKDYQSNSFRYLYESFIEPLAEDEHPSDEFMDFWYDCTFKEDNATELEFDKFLGFLKQESQVLSKATWKNILLGGAVSNFKDAYYILDTSIPALVLHGLDDTMCKNEYQEELREIFGVPDTSYRNYEGVGHNIQFEITDRSSKDILYWLENGVLPEE